MRFRKEKMIHSNMKKILFALSLFLLASVSQAQNRFYTKNAKINFYSETSLEDIEAKNKSAVTVLDTKNGSLQFSLLIKGFEFKNDEMQEHFNEDYMESDKFPKAEFKGQVVNNAAVNYTKAGTYNVQVKGLLTIHGVTKEIQTNGTIKVDNDGLKSNSSFNIAIADYGIKIPRLVRDKIAKTVKITVDAKLEPLK
jgi:polyisoprenoid-binding protein YceI